MTRNVNAALPRAHAPSSTTLRLISFVFVGLTLIALAAVAYFTERGIAVSRDWVVHTYQVRSQLNDLQLELMRSQASETDNFRMREGQQLPQSREEVALATHTVSELRRLTQDNPRQQERLNALGAILKERVSLMESQPGSGRKREDAIGVRQRQVDSIVRSMQDEEESLLEQRLKSWDYLFKRNVMMLGIAFAVVILMLAYNFRLLAREVSRTRDTEKRVRDNAESYRSMSAKILELQDSERRRIARELHDSVGQYLAGLKINLNQLENGERAEPLRLIRETIGLTDCAIQEVRTISHLLHPPLLEELGFLSAARWYLDEFGKRGQVKVALSVVEPVDRLPQGGRDRVIPRSTGGAHQCVPPCRSPICGCSNHVPRWACEFNGCRRRERDSEGGAGSVPRRSGTRHRPGRNEGKTCGVRRKNQRGFIKQWSGRRGDYPHGVMRDD